jgi:orotidine-5'-phosphate decarboxylase
MKDRKFLTPAERLIVAADFKPDLERFRGRLWVRDQVIKLASALEGTGVYLKVNSALRANGYDLIARIHSFGLKVFADLKLNDISETLATDGMLLREAEPELLTVMCSTGIKGMHALREELPDTTILGVTVLTSLKQENLSELGYPVSISVDVVARAMAESSCRAGLGGNICSPKEAGLISGIRSAQHMMEMLIVTPGIRLEDKVVIGDDQNPDRVMTPARAIAAGADMIVAGRQIIQAEDPRSMVVRMIDEIASAVG